MKNYITQTTKSIHFLCIGHVIQNIEKKFSECLIPNILQHGIPADISGKKDLINEESLEDYDERLVSVIEKWHETEKHRTKNNRP